MKKFILLIVVTILFALSACLEPLQIAYRLDFYGIEYPQVYQSEQKQTFLISNQKYEVVTKVENSNDNDISFLNLYISSQSNNSEFVFNHLFEEQPCIYKWRGEVSLNDTLLLYIERWTGRYCAQYIENFLDHTIILEIDINNGQIINQQICGQNEFVISVRDQDVYIYNLGNLYVRNLKFWHQKNQIANLNNTLSESKLTAILFNVENETIDIFKLMDTDNKYKNEKKLMLNLKFEPDRKTILSVDTT